MNVHQTGLDTMAAPDTADDMPPVIAQVRRLIELLAVAEQDSRSVWTALAGADAAAAERAVRCYRLIQDALVVGAVDLAAALRMNTDDLPG